MKLDKKLIIIKLREGYGFIGKLILLLNEVAV